VQINAQKLINVYAILTRTKCMFRPARKYPPTLPLFFSDDCNTSA